MWEFDWGVFWAFLAAFVVRTAIAIRRQWQKAGEAWPEARERSFLTSDEGK